jgi:putative DNA primase/helicase
MSDQDENPNDDNVVNLEQARDQSNVAADLSDDNLAMRVVAKHGDVIRHVGQWNRWMHYTGKVWEVDYNDQTSELTRKVLRDWARRIFAGEMQRGIDNMPSNLSDHDKKGRIRNLKKNALSIVRPMKSFRTINHVVSLAKHDPKVIQSVDAWDSDPWLLNTPDGTVDLKTGGIRKHNPMDYMTMTTAVGPSLEQPTRWLEFLKQITDGDNDLISYFQRIFGYGLTGLTGEHAMFFIYGTGGNGKSVILNTIDGLLKTYSKPSGMETFLLSNGNQHPTELANLRGARIVTASETQAGRKWDEVKVKRLTGGDPISARFMRQDFFEFFPQFKLFVTGNHKPHMANVDEAMRRRFNLIALTVSIPNEKRDINLQKKLQEEWPAILNWMVEGCIEWQQKGLAAPDAVRSATDNYMALEDHFGSWWQESCEPSARGFEKVADLYDSWVAWCQRNTEVAGGKKTFSQTLSGRAEVLKIKYYQTNEGRGFRGVTLKGKGQ